MKNENNIELWRTSDGEYITECSCGHNVNLGDYLVDDITMDYVVRHYPKCYNKSLEYRIHNPLLHFEKDNDINRNPSLTKVYNS